METSQDDRVRDESQSDISAEHRRIITRQVASSVEPVDQGPRYQKAVEKKVQQNVQVEGDTTTEDLKHSAYANSINTSAGSVVRCERSLSSSRTPLVGNSHYHSISPRPGGFVQNWE